MDREKLLEHDSSKEFVISELFHVIKTNEAGEQLNRTALSSTKTLPRATLRFNQMRFYTKFARCWFYTTKAKC